MMLMTHRVARRQFTSQGARVAEMANGMLQQWARHSINIPDVVTSIRSRAPNKNSAKDLGIILI